MWKGSAHIRVGPENVQVVIAARVRGAGKGTRAVVYATTQGTGGCL
jgi:hypothetical protein